MSSDDHQSSNQDSVLDDLALETLNLMQQIINSKLQLQEIIKAGTINLAKSRYIMGNRSVSTMQLPTEESVPFNALCKVVEGQHDVNGISTTVFSLRRQEPAKRTVLNDKQGDLEVSHSSSGNDPNLCCDPTQWFGVLVPQNLRLAQSSFKDAVELTVKIASLQAQLEAYRIEFCTLKMDKLQLSSK